MKLILIKKYERCCLSRWGWHTFRQMNRYTGRYTGKIIGFRFLGIGLTWGTSSNITEQSK